MWCPLRVPCCDVRYKFHIQTMLGSSLPPVICKAACLVFFIYAWLRIMVPDTFCAVFLCCFFSSYGNLILPVSLGCTFVVLSLRYSLTFINIYDIYIYIYYYQLLCDWWLVFLLLLCGLFRLIVRFSWQFRLLNCYFCLSTKAIFFLITCKYNIVLN